MVTDDVISKLWILLITKMRKNPVIFITDRAISLLGNLIRQLERYNEIKPMTSIALLVVLTFNKPGFGVDMEFFGQATGAVTVGTDPADKRSHFEETLSYIPTISLAQPIEPDNLIDFEGSLNSTAVLDGFLGSGEGGTDVDTRLFRLWATSG